MALCFPQMKRHDGQIAALRLVNLDVFVNEVRIIRGAVRPLSVLLLAELVRLSLDPPLEFLRLHFGVRLRRQ